MERIGKYVVHKRAVTTGYAHIYFCHDPDLQVPVAIKIFNPEAGDGPMSPAQLSSRFLVEARALATFDHPYIVPVKALEHADNGRPFFIMPFQAAHLAFEIGKDFADAAVVAAAPERDRPRRLFLPRALVVLKQVASALAALHRRGMVHRAVKPSNILLTAREGGVVRLSDLSMVKLPEKNPPLPDHWIGATEYCAPEQRENATGVDARADVFSLGVLAYRVITGGLPDLSAGAVEIPSVPDALSELVRAATDPDPGKRPAHGGAMLELLGKVTLDRPKGTVKVVTVPRPASRRVAEPAV